MLKIDVCGCILDDIGFPDAYFDNMYYDEWFDDPIVKQIVKDIDKSDVISANNIISPVLGLINCLELSTGCKNLIIAYKTDEIIDATNCGDNCGDWLLKIAEMKDLSVTLYHTFGFNRDFDALILNTGKIVHTYVDFVRTVAPLVEANWEYSRRKFG